MFKVIIIGDANAGKTSLINRYVNSTFSCSYKATVGVDFRVRETSVEGPESKHTPIKLQLWDIAGQERFRKLTRAYYNNSHGICVVFDISCKEEKQTLLNVAEWIVEAHKLVGDAPAILLANKCDLLNKYEDEEEGKFVGECENNESPSEKVKGREGEKEELDDFCERYGFMGWYYTSAKDNINIDEPFRALGKAMLEALDRDFLPCNTCQQPATYICRDYNIYLCDECEMKHEHRHRHVPLKLSQTGKDSEILAIDDMPIGAEIRLTPNADGRNLCNCLY